MCRFRMLIVTTVSIVTPSVGTISPPSYANWQLNVQFRKLNKTDIDLFYLLLSIIMLLFILKWYWKPTSIFWLSTQEVEGLRRTTRSNSSSNRRSSSSRETGSIFIGLCFNVSFFLCVSLCIGWYKHVNAALRPLAVEMCPVLALPPFFLFEFFILYILFFLSFVSVFLFCLFRGVFLIPILLIQFSIGDGNYEWSDSDI